MSDCCEDPDPTEHIRDGSWYCRNCDTDLDTPEEYTYTYWETRALKAEKERDALEAIVDAVIDDLGEDYVNVLMEA